MKRIAFILAAICISFTAFSQQKETAPSSSIPQPKNPDVERILKNAAATLKDPQGVIIDYGLAFKDIKNKKSRSSNGKITLKGEKFHLFSTEIEVWYNGKTQWSYSRAAGEINVTEPEKNEIENISPFFLVDNYNKNYECSYLRYTYSQDNNQYVHCLKLTPKDKKSNIDYINVNIFDRNYIPYMIVINEKDGATTHIEMKNVDQQKKIDETTFTFDKNLYPDADVIDLR